jgi:hypothetical protein
MPTKIDLEGEEAQSRALCLKRVWRVRCVVCGQYWHTPGFVESRQTVERELRELGWQDLNEGTWTNWVCPEHKR